MTTPNKVEDLTLFFLRLHAERIRLEWECSGELLHSSTITVATMLDEIDNLVKRVTESVEDKP